MSLTQQDLKAISRLIDSSNDSLEDRLVARIDDLDDVLSLQMEQGLQEVRERIDAVDTTLSQQLRQISDKLDNHHFQLDNHEERIAKLEDTKT